MPKLLPQPQVLVTFGLSNVKAALVETIVEVDGGPIQVQVALLVDSDLYAVLIRHKILGLIRLVIEPQLVLEPAAAAPDTPIRRTMASDIFCSSMTRLNSLLPFSVTLTMICFFSASGKDESNGWFLGAFPEPPHYRHRARSKKSDSVVALQRVDLRLARRAQNRQTRRRFSRCTCPGSMWRSLSP